MNETQLVKMILQYLHLKGVFAFRNNTGMHISEYKGTRRAVRFGQPGSADILGVIKHGRALAIEAKVKPNKPTVTQAAWLQRFSEAGGLAIIAYNLDDVEKWEHVL